MHFLISSTISGSIDHARAWLQLTCCHVLFKSSFVRHLQKTEEGISTYHIVLKAIRTV